MSDEIAAARRALARGEAREASWPLLQRWRETRDADLANVLDRLLRVQAGRGEVIVQAPSGSREEQSWRALQLHPCIALDAPDPRATLAWIGAGLSPYPYGWSEAFAARLVAHGDPRVIAWLDVACGDEFVAERARLAEQLPTPTPLGEAERAELDALTAEVEALEPDVVFRPDRWRYALEEARQALVFATLFGPLLRFVAAPRFEAGQLRSVHVVGRERALRLLRGHPSLQTVRELTFYASDGRAEDRAAAIALLGSLPGVERVGPLSLAHVQGLAGMGSGWTSLKLLPRGESSTAWAHAFAALPPTRVEEIHVIDRALSVVQDLVRALPPHVTAVFAVGGFDDLDAWLAVLPATVLRFEQEAGRGWEIKLRRAPGEAWSLELNLPWRWAEFESRWEDPPTPGAELVEWLREAEATLLCALTVRNCGELGDYAPILEAAWGQAGLDCVRVEDDDGRIQEVRRP